MLMMGTGNLVKDPEEVQTSTGKKLCRFTIASNGFYTKDGEKQVEYYNLIAWEKLAENCLKYLKKGSKVYVIGNPQTRRYEKDGETKYISEIVIKEIEFLSSSKSE